MALGSDAFDPAAMNGLGPRPLPAAICSMARPEATDCPVSATIILAGEFVAVLDQQPVVALAAVAGRASCARAQSCPCSFSPASVNLSSPLRRAASTSLVAFGHPEAAVPQHDRAAAILALGDRAFEVAVVERMVLHLDRQALVGRIERRALRHRPGLEDAIVLQAEIVVQPGGRMLLDDEARVLGRPNLGLAARLGGFLEIALGLVGRPVSSLPSIIAVWLTARLRLEPSRLCNGVGHLRVPPAARDSWRIDHGQRAGLTGRAI